MLALYQVRDEVHKTEDVVPIRDLLNDDVDDVSEGGRHEVLNLLDLRRWVSLPNQYHPLDIKRLDADDQRFGLKTHCCNHYVDHTRSPAKGV